METFFEKYFFWPNLFGILNIFVNKNAIKRGRVSNDRIGLILIGQLADFSFGNLAALSGTSPSLTVIPAAQR